MSNILRVNIKSFSPNKTLNLFNSARNVRAIRKVFRSKLPKYKRDLKDLPQLTQLLNITSKYDTDMRLEKLKVYKSYFPQKTSTILLEAMLNPHNDVDALLRIIDDNLQTMTSFYLALSFEVLDDMVRLESCHPSTVAVSNEFKNLCSRTLYRIRFFECDDVLKVLKCLASLQVPEDFLVTQAALQMARHWINDFDAKELETLSTVLSEIDNKKEDSTRILPAIMQSIPKLIQKLVDNDRIASENTLKLVANSDLQ